MAVAVVGELMMGLVKDMVVATAVPASSSFRILWVLVSRSSLSPPQLGLRPLVQQRLTISL